MVVSEQTYRALTLEDAVGRWELHDGRPVEKPGMGAEHNDVMARLAIAIGNHLDWAAYRLRINASHVRRTGRNDSIPDLCVVPTDRFREQLGQPGLLEIYEDPLPLVIEIRSPSTGSYDVDAKLRQYQARGDLEIWRLHPFERTLVWWRRQPDGSYLTGTQQGGHVESAAIQGLVVGLDAIFDCR